MALTDKLTAIADAIRGKTGKTEEMTLAQMATEIEGIETGGGGDNSIAWGILDGSLTELECAEITNLRDLAFQQHANITRVKFPNIVNITVSSLRSCPKLELVDVGSKCLWIQANSMRDSSSLKTLILRRTDAPVSFVHTTGLQGTPFYTGGTGGTVYCPSALIEQYQTATNWSVLYTAGTCNFVALEGSEYE